MTAATAGMIAGMIAATAVIAGLRIGAVETVATGESRRRPLPLRKISRPSCEMSSAISGRAGVLTVEAVGAAAATGIARLARSLTPLFRSRIAAVGPISSRSCFK